MKATPISSGFADFATITALALIFVTASRASASTYLWNVPTPGANNWNVNANWSPSTGIPGPADTAMFGPFGTSPNATTINNVVSVSTFVTTLQFTNYYTAGQFHVTQIPANTTLTVSGTLTVGGITTNNATYAAMVNAGTLLVTGIALNVGNNGGNAFSSGTILDLSGLSNFVYSSSSGTVGIGTAGNRSGGNLTLAAASNSITAATINLETTSSSSSGSGTINLGPGTNLVNASAINIAAQRSSGTLQFNLASGGLRLRGTGGTDADRANIVVGNRSTAASTTPATTTGTIALNGHPVDLKLGTLTLGQNAQTANTNIAGAGVFQFDQGTVDVSTIAMGICGGNSATLSLTNGANGTLTMGGGTLLIGSGGVSLANLTSTAAGSYANGTLAIFGGTAVCSNNIVKTTAGLSTGTVAVAYGSLWVQGKIGTPAIPVDNLNVTNAALRLNVDGSGAITTNICVNSVNAGGTTTFDIAQVTGVDGPTTFPLIHYSTLNGTVAGNFTLTYPAGYVASLVDNSAQQRIDLSISPSVIITPLVWTGAMNGDWDLTTSNWTSAGALATYTDASATVFDDTASNNLVNLTTAVAPASMTMSNSVLNYTFTGSGSIVGTNSLTLKGSQTTIWDNSGSNNFTGGTLIRYGTLQIGNNDTNGNLPDGQPVVDCSMLAFNRTDSHTNSSVISGTGSLAQNGSGTLTLAGANSYGATTISTGTLQVGAGGTSGSLGSGAVTDNGSLIFNRSDNLTVANVINGSGSVTKVNNNVLTLSGNNSYGGGLTVNAGTVRLANVAAAGAAATSGITVNSGGTVVLVATNIANNITLAGGTLGAQYGAGGTSIVGIPPQLTAAPATTSTILVGDPANLIPGQADSTEMNFTNTWHGSGNLIVTTVLNDNSPDTGSGLRLRSPLASDFSGSITLSNTVKGELQTTVAGPFSPAGTGKIVLYGGVLTNNTVNGTYSELNLRNQTAGATVFGNDIELAGSGIAILDPLGVAPSGSTVTMGNLKIGNGQELGVNLNGTANPPTNHPVVFPTVTLNGGNATFSPKTAGWNTAPQWGSDLFLGNISELVANSGFTMNGLRTLKLTGTNTYSGSTTVNNGTLEVDGVNAGTGSVTVEAGATLDGVGLIAGPVTIAAGGTLSPGNATTTTNATLTISNSLTLAGTSIMDVNKSGSVFTGDLITNITTVTYGGTLQLNLTGTALTNGDAFKLYSCASASGAFATIIPPTPGTGLLWNTNTLTTGVLSVVSAVKPMPAITNFSLSGTTLTIQGTNGSANGQYLLLGTTNLALPLSQWTPLLTNAFDSGGNFNLVTNIVNASDAQQFYILSQ